MLKFPERTSPHDRFWTKEENDNKLTKGETQDSQQKREKIDKSEKVKTTEEIMSYASTEQM